MSRLSHLEIAFRKYKATTVRRVARENCRTLVSKPVTQRSRLPLSSMNALTQTSKRAIPAPPNDAVNIRPGWFWISGLAGFSIALYCTSAFYGWRAAWKKSKELLLQQDADVSNRYDKIANRYDTDIDVTERLMLLEGKRKLICQQAKGHVLEVSAGTGRNGRFYNVESIGGGKGAVSAFKLKQKDDRVKSITFVDQSPKMLAICAQRWKEEHPQFQDQVSFAVADAGAKGAIHPPLGSDGFDTIIQTFGLCSVTNPVEYLNTLRGLLKQPGVDGSGGGRVLLLEHGRGYYWWINYLLDGLAKEHADRFGCWWNRDIGSIVQDSELAITRVKRYHLGTTWALELHANSELPAQMQDKREN